MELKIRDEEEYFIITLLGVGCRVHLYYIHKEELKRTRNLDIVAMHKESIEEFGDNVVSFISYLQYNKVPSHL